MMKTQQVEAFAELRTRRVCGAGDLFQCAQGQRAQLAGIHAAVRTGQGDRPGNPGAGQGALRSHLLHAQTGGGVQGTTQARTVIRVLSSQDMGLPLAVRALAVDRKALRAGIPFQRGGGTARLVAPGWVIWAAAPDRFEAGTPAIVNIIAFARALQLMPSVSARMLSRMRVRKRLTAAEILCHDQLDEYSGQELLDELRQLLIGRNVLVPTLEGAQALYQPG
jgi:hypothetical protein